MPTYNSTGSLMLPTKKRKADGTIVDADKAFNDYVSTLPENQRDSKSFNVRRYWELNGRPANFDEAVNRGMFNQRNTVTADGVQNGGNTVATQETGPQLDSYDKMLEYLKANQGADADAAGRARKRELMAAIGDGISAVSSLYQTTKGAPVTYTPGADMSKVMRDRYDRMIAQRKAKNDEYLNYLKLQAAKDKEDKTAAYQNWKMTHDEKKLEEQKRHNEVMETNTATNIANRGNYYDERAATEREKSDLRTAFDMAEIQALREGRTPEEAEQAGEAAMLTMYQEILNAHRDERKAKLRKINSSADKDNRSNQGKKSGGTSNGSGKSKGSTKQKKANPMN